MNWKVLAVFVFAASFANAQKNYKKEDKRLYKEAEFFMGIEDYSSAIKLLDLIYPIDPDYAEVNYLLGLCHFNVPGNAKKATFYLEIAKSLGYTEAYFWLGRAYHADLRFSDAKKSYMYYKAKPNKLLSEKEILYYIEITKRAEHAVENPVHVKIGNIGPAINTGADEYMPFVNDDETKMYFTSKRPNNTGGIANDGSFFDDVFLSENKQGMWTAALPISSLNSNYNDAIVGISADGSSVIINRSEKGRSSGVLYVATFEEGVWSKPVLLSNTINSSHKQTSATFVGDGSVIYFSSDRPGGLGGKDIWKTRRLPDGSWAEPINLGGPINTPFDEDAPFYHPNGEYLYFSSNGHTTIGGHDVFKAKARGDGSWQTPENLGYPINSVNDDVYFTISRNNKNAYLSSYRDGGEGGSDIYRVSLIFEDNYLTAVKLKLKDNNGQMYNGAISLFDSKTGDLFGEYKANKNNEFIVIVKPEIEYDFEINTATGETINTTLFISLNELNTGEVFKIYEMGK
ncbi:MAG: hypothetical protein ACK4K0_03800 [Flavobacteriales bacterium]